MKKFIKTVSLCALVALIVYACMGLEMDPIADESTESDVSTENAERHRPLRARDARAWLEETQPPVALYGQQRASGLRSSELDGREPINRQLWGHARRSQNEQFSVVEVPVHSTLQRFIVRTNQPFEITESPGISRLVIRRNMFTGHVDAFVQTFTGDSMYIAQPNFRRNLFQNRYLTRDPNFSGTEVITSLQGEFLKGFFVENGRQIGRFGEPVLGRDNEQYESFGGLRVLTQWKDCTCWDFVEFGFCDCNWDSEWEDCTCDRCGWCGWPTSADCPDCRNSPLCLCCQSCGALFGCSSCCRPPCNSGCSNCGQLTCYECFPWDSPTHRVVLRINPSTGGTVSSVRTGVTYTFTASPNQNYIFVNWTWIGGTAGSGQSINRQLSFVVTGPKTVTANFRRR